MKKFFIVLGIIFACLIVISIIGFSIFNTVGTKLDKESKVYTDTVVPIIISSWNLKELTDRASPEFLKEVPLDKLESMFNMFSAKLGKFKTYKGSEGMSNIDISSQGKVITAQYLAKADFEKASAIFKIALILHDEKWQILGFYVESEAFLDNSAKKVLIE